MSDSPREVNSTASEVRAKIVFEIIKRIIYLFLLLFIFFADETRPTNWWHRRHRNQQRRRHRRKLAGNSKFQKRVQNRSGCAGTCQNMLSCMFSGQKVDWDAHKTCPGMLDACCTTWAPKKKYFRNRIKSGRSLGLFSPQVQVFWN